MEEKCDVCNKKVGVNSRKYCTVSWRTKWEKLFGCRGKKLPLKGEIWLCEGCNKEYENECGGKEEEKQQKQDYQRIFGTNEPTLTQLREKRLKEWEESASWGKEKNPEKTIEIWQKNVLQDSSLDSEDALISAVYLINFGGLKKLDISEQQWKEKIKSDSYFCEQLTKFHNSPSDSVAGKVWKVFIKHGIPLDKYYSYLENDQEKKRRQSEFTKQRIINSLQDWGIEVYQKEGKKAPPTRIINQKNKFDNFEKELAEEKDWQEIIKLLNRKELQWEDCRWPTAEEYKKWVFEINPETRLPWDPPLTEQQKKIIQDPILTSPGTRPFHPTKKEDLKNPYYSVPDIAVDTISKVLECFSYLQKAQEQIEQKLAENSFWGEVGEYYTFQQFEKIQKAPADTDLGKVRQALENNGISLTSEIKKLNERAKSKSRELKERIIKNPADYGIDSNQLSNTFANFNDRYASINKFFLTSEDYQQAKRAIIEHIKKNKREWRIVKRWVPVCPGGYVKLIINKKTGNYHYEGGFTKQEWKEIEKVIGNGSGILIFLIVIILLSLSLFGLWWYKKKKNKY